MELRWYQQEAVEAVYNHLCTQAGNPIVCLPTGSGKSLVIAELARKAVEEFGGRVLVLQHRKELISQNADKVRKLISIPVGEYSAGLRRYATTEDVVLCGIQSVYNKASLFDVRNLILIDEAHLCSPSDESMYQTFLNDIRTINPTSRIVGLTATPYRTGEGALCRADGVFQKLVYNAPIKQLMEEGFLCKVTNKPTVNEVDTSGLHMRYGEFITKEVDALFGGMATAQACKEVLQACVGRHSIMVFCSSVKHAEGVVSTLRTLTDDRVEMVEGGTSPLERAAILDGFVKQSIRILVNVDVLCLDEQTEILCRDGWCSIDEINSEKLVAAWDTDGSITFDHPKTIVRRPMMEDEVFATLKTNAVDIRVTSNHRMVVSVGAEGDKRWAIKQAFEIIGKKVSMPAHGFSKPETFKAKETQTEKKTRQARIRSLAYVYKKRLSLSQEDARAMAEKETSRKESFLSKLPSELTTEECMLIGIWIGDGTKSCGRVSIAQSMVYSDNVELIDRLLEITGIQHSRKIYPSTSKTASESIRWTLARGTGSGDQSRNGYYGIEEYLDKDGSDLLWGLNEKQFQAVLYGWWIADGVHHGKHRNGMRVSCVNKKLIDKFQAIATCRGVRTSVRVCSKPRSEKHQQQWTMSWCSAKVISVVKNRFVEEKPSKGERVWCVTSSTGNIVTRRNGKVCVVGNTTGFDAPCVDAIAILRATASPGLFAQIVGRGLRTHVSKQDCLILDFGANIKRHGPIDAIDFGKPRSLKGEALPIDDEGKECPNCQLVVPSRKQSCECGFRFSVRVPTHEEKADTVAQIISEPEVFQVASVRYYKHEKEGKTPSLRVDYHLDTEGNLEQMISEWVCLEHSGFARKKAEAWWAIRCELEAPTSVSDALEVASVIAVPRSITAVKEGKFWRIVEAEIEEIPDSSLLFVTEEEEMPF